MITTVFFDAGATLLTTAADEGCVFAQLAADLDVKLEPEVVNRHVPHMYEFYEQLYEQDDSFWSDDIRAKAIWIEMYELLSRLVGVPIELQKQLSEKVYAYYFSPGAWQVFSDVVPTLEALKAKGVQMGIISNWDSSLAAIIDGLGLKHYFNHIIASAEVSAHKPMPQIFKLALERLGVTAAQSVHVGDHLLADVAGAAAVGITPVLIDRTGKHTDANVLRVEDLRQLPGLISQ
ncbi:MAG: HAD-IA family hydrolase [Coriobacteriales bacterium]|jgi:putative hydrolase of the HAD superfamily|nr:HAD-IA family hydrolase [Coriobacteriales bacterium]